MTFLIINVRIVWKGGGVMSEICTICGTREASGDSGVCDVCYMKVKWHILGRGISRFATAKSKTIPALTGGGILMLFIGL